MKNKYQVSFVDNMIDWAVYLGFALLFLSPFFSFNTLHGAMQLVGLSLIVSFGLGMINRLIRELVFIKELLIEKRKDDDK